MHNLVVITVVPIHPHLVNHLWTQQDLIQMVLTATKEAIPEAEVRNTVVIWLVTTNTNETLATLAYLQQLDDEHVYKFIKHIDQDTQSTKAITYYVGIIQPHLAPCHLILKCMMLPAVSPRQLMSFFLTLL